MVAVAIEIGTRHIRFDTEIGQDHSSLRKLGAQRPFVPEVAAAATPPRRMSSGTRHAPSPSPHLAADSDASTQPDSPILHRDFPTTVAQQIVGRQPNALYQRVADLANEIIAFDSRPDETWVYAMECQLSDVLSNAAYLKNPRKQYVRCAPMGCVLYIETQLFVTMDLHAGDPASAGSALEGDIRSRPWFADFDEIHGYSVLVGGQDANNYRVEVLRRRTPTN